MASTFEDFIQSHQFTFFVGQEGTPIMVHAAAIAAASQQLNALINGGMEESKKRCARIEDVTVDDFIRFCEYAYRGDYTSKRRPRRREWLFPRQDLFWNQGYLSRS
ncbi:hypothetical protein BCR34DRAFT_588707 [Clohesyomyces aquaticus]|uniref:BTB domain-containing protein n=1 Tax=Clohesyomyces aquaticus TaxID=1231657 RepID=A0A1Y1ZIZ1_9PLEO|nr:hypothetical protein BCR34DRAFT_588707 [Clohesyomyces aquaticus]